MAPLDAIRALSDGVADRLADRRWNEALLAKKIRDMRVLRGLTQRELAERMGVTETAVRNYELMRALPKGDNVERMAEALGVRPECLRLYDFGMYSVFASAVFQLCDTYGLSPRSEEGYACLVPGNSFVEGLLRSWAGQYARLRDGERGRDAYELWKDAYDADFDPRDFPKRFLEGGLTGDLAEPWVPLCFGSAIRRHRENRGMTQGEFARLLGVRLGVYRSYEQGRRLPKVSVVCGIAAALGVTEGSLTFFDYGTPVQAAHALFQLAAERDLVPDMDGDTPVLRTMGPAAEQVIDQWALAFAGTYECAGESVGGMREWMDRYDPEASRAGSSWESRYRVHWRRVESGSLVPDGWESDFDPYDESVEGGHVRA